MVFAEPNYTLELDSDDYSGGINPGEQEDPEGSETDTGEQEDPEGSETDTGEQEDPEGGETDLGEQEITEGGESTTGAQEGTEGIEVAPQTQENSQRRLAAQPKDGPLSDLTPLQWGNWSTDQTTRAEGMAANPSINVPGFGAVGRKGNMDKQIVVALLDTGVYNEHPDLENVVYHFSPEQQEALGCWER